MLNIMIVLFNIKKKILLKNMIANLTRLVRLFMASKVNQGLKRHGLFEDVLPKIEDREATLI